MNQAALFDMSPHPRYRHADPDTSRNVARSASNVTPQILAIYAGGGTFTDDELCQALADCYGPTVVSARSRLTRDGKLVDTGERRLSARRRPQAVWKKA